MSLPEKMYEDFKGFAKGMLGAIALGYIVYVYVLAVGLSNFWHTGRYFWAIVLAFDVVVGCLAFGVMLGPLLKARKPSCGAVMLSVICFVTSLILCGFAG